MDTLLQELPFREDGTLDINEPMRHNCQLLYADTELLGVNPPMFIEVEITSTDPGFKGDTVQGGTKPATIETGATIQVPMYLNQGEKVKVDTRTGKFVSRV